MAKGKFVKLANPIMASDLFQERPGRKIQVIVRSLSNQQGHWGRGWAIQNALRAAAWIGQGESVCVALCTKDARIGVIDGSVVEGQVGDWYKGRVMANKDVTITHRWEPEKQPTSRSTGTVTGRTAMSVDGKLTSSSGGKAK